MSLENFPRKGRRAPVSCCSGRSAATAGGLKGVELLELVKWPPNTASTRPRFARGQRLDLAKVRVVRAHLRRKVRAAGDAHVSYFGSIINKISIVFTRVRKEPI
jgi:hypothetical protein